jgi:transcriptional regulator NrdR family protein
MKHVIKESGLIEVYSATKHRQSIVKSLQAVDAPDAQIDSIAEAVLIAANIWLTNKHEVTYKDIRAFTARQLEKHDKNAAIVYKKHKDIW